MVPLQQRESVDWMKKQRLLFLKNQALFLMPIVGYLISFRFYDTVQNDKVMAEKALPCGMDE